MLILRYSHELLVVPPQAARCRHELVFELFRWQRYCGSRSAPAGQPYSEPQIRSASAGTDAVVACSSAPAVALARRSSVLLPRHAVHLQLIDHVVRVLPLRDRLFQLGPHSVYVGLDQLHDRIPISAVSSSMKTKRPSSLFFRTSHRFAIIDDWRDALSIRTLGGFDSLTILLLALADQCKWAVPYGDYERLVFTDSCGWLIPWRL